MLSFLIVLINVVIPVLSQVPAGPPTIGGPDVIVRGETIVLTCYSTGGSPTPTVKWYRDNTEITTGISTSTSGSTVTTTYTFVATLSEHYEVFECQADNGVLQNPLKAEKFVYVNFTPNTPLLSGPLSLVDGDKGTWTCTSANGYPAGTMMIKNKNTGITFGPPEYSVVTTTVNGGRSFTVTGTLNWSPALSNNNHQLCCEVAHPTTIITPQSNCLTLALRPAAPLNVNAPITSYTPVIGDPVILQCVFTSGTAWYIQWFKEDTQLNITTNSRYSNGNVDSPSLTISGVQQSDAGNYTCRASDGSVTVSTNIINVNPGTPPVETMPLTLNFTGTLGNSIVLDCTVQSLKSPLQSVQWIFKSFNKQVTDSIVITSPKYSGSTPSDPSLTINDVQFTDAGYYRCRATNLYGTTTSYYTILEVRDSISSQVLAISPDIYTAAYGSQLIINCVILSASPSLYNIFWTRQLRGIKFEINNGDYGYQGSTIQTPSLTIDSVIPSQHTGIYKCHGEHVNGTEASNQADVSITGGLLTINQSPASANVLRGSSTTINCILSGTPLASNIVWLFTSFQGSHGVLNKVLNKHTGGTTSTPSLTINNFQSTDAGTYRCEAVNAAGTASSNISSVLIYMAELAINAPITSYTPTIGSTVTLQCVIISGTPSVILWFKGDTELNLTTNNRYSNGNLVIPSLTISSVQQSDAGDYTCRGIDENVTVSSGIIHISPQDNQEQSSTVYVAVISVLAVTLVILIILSVKRRTVDNDSISGQRQSIPVTYDNPNGETNPHFYNTTDVYDRISEQETTSNYLTAIDEPRTSSSDNRTTSIELHHGYTELY